MEGRVKREIPGKTIGIVRHDSHIRKSRAAPQGIEPGSLSGPQAECVKLHRYRRLSRRRVSTTTSAWSVMDDAGADSAYCGMWSTRCPATACARAAPHTTAATTLYLQMVEKRENFYVSTYIRAGPELIWQTGSDHRGKWAQKEEDDVRNPMLQTFHSPLHASQFKFALGAWPCLTFTSNVFGYVCRHHTFGKARQRDGSNLWSYFHVLSSWNNVPAECNQRKTVHARGHMAGNNCSLSVARRHTKAVWEERRHLCWERLCEELTPLGESVRWHGEVSDLHCAVRGLDTDICTADCIPLAVSPLPFTITLCSSFVTTSTVLPPTLHWVRCHASAAPCSFAHVGHSRVPEFDSWPGFLIPAFPCLPGNQSSRHGSPAYRETNSCVSPGKNVAKPWQFILSSPIALFIGAAGLRSCRQLVLNMCKWTKCKLSWTALNIELCESLEEWSSARMKGLGETGDTRENLPTNDIVRHDSHMRKSGSDPAED
ncbi:hypothetical protein PR048_018353 [Dryococelus australis]|uniref:Uncharacterized protein n=1 Tax=Dryococelus australis TaxID=614101 RepID=A0ABQ9HC09_9NEOP|nr:hypothetical protein PR048_018353 [Dryococelus australis]